MLRSLVVVTAHALALATLVTAACSSKPPEELPPAGLAGAPDAPRPPGANGSSTHATPQPSAALTQLPGMGYDVAAPSGSTPETAQLPPGHPPIDTAPTIPGTTPGAAPFAGPQASAPPMGGAGTGADDVQLSGKVLELIDVPNYTYMRVQGASGEEWVAVNTTKLKVGDTVTVTSQLVMENFHSSSLNRTFPKLVMGMMVGAPKP